ncbi:MAG TPA: N-6 DNA methylase, partial [Candidatus Acidoferrum sp.]|nr:N-6 DNA methylase [Candidatus Acidoferrum sp.]
MPASLTYDAVVGLDHRLEHGQFFTPPAVARFMLQWVTESGVPALYDPAFGLGALHPRNGDIDFTASELDP